MLDLGEIDRELEALGQAPEAISTLIERELGADRSTERLAAELSALDGAAPITVAKLDGVMRKPPSIRVRAPISAPPFELLAPGARPGSKPPNARSTLVGQPGSGGVVAADVLRDIGVEPPAPAHADSASDDGDLDAIIDYHDDGVQPLPDLAAAPDATPYAGNAMEALLEQDLDPRDFPQSEPPPPKPASIRPSLAPAVPAARSAEAAEDDDFELLVEDDEILEIDDVELVEDDE